MDVKITYAQNAPQEPQASAPTYQSYNYPAPNLNPAYPQPVQAVQPQGCFARNQKNKPQTNSAGAASLVFISGGMNIALGVGPIPIAYAMVIHMRISWFIGAIIGAIFGAALCNRLSKKCFYLLSSVLITIGGILFVSLKNDVDGLIAARYLDGIANGFVLVPTLVMAGEVAVKSVRGMIASSIETMCFGLGIFLQLIISSTWLSSPTLSFGPIQIQGILSIIYGVISMILTFFLVIESPVFLLLRGEEQNAIDSLRRLQRPFVVTTETYEQFEEHKRYIAINGELSVNESAIAGLPALFKLCIYRGLLALSYSSLLNFVFLVSAVKFYASYDITPFIIYGTMRWLGLIISVFMMDSVGRKKPMLIGMIICAGMAIGIGGSIINAPLDLSAVPALMFVFQFFAGIASTSSSVYLSEAFPLAIKPYYIASAFIVEMIVHIILCTVSHADAGAFFCTVGSFMAAFFVFGLLFMPETKETTLREAQEKFRNFK